ncbi:hypothetical protein L1987_79261 [Smallanthus sonchifolius]|uniref:Uncharacterized protein n=1 Tax=Smallanthus sonchifolius TaxID=185202 RepID=A0ACB8ZJE7_9ASTR|nr:hypothetical protein L1987_79261 [Smallanthus sonchifolius]
MGNYVSACSFSFSPKMKTSKAARVIFPTGEIRQFQDSVKAAEIMFDCPNFFLVNSQSLKINRRFSPLSADEDLESGNVYLMFPMRRASSIVTPGDMAVFWLSASSAPKRISVRISPESALGGDEAETPPRLVVDLPEFSHRLRVSRSKKPVLDTIKEEPVRSK